MSASTPSSRSPAARAFGSPLGSAPIPQAFEDPRTPGATTGSRAEPASSPRVATGAGLPCPRRSRSSVTRPRRRSRADSPRPSSRSRATCFLSGRVSGRRARRHCADGVMSRIDFAGCLIRYAQADNFGRRSLRGGGAAARSSDGEAGTVSDAGERLRDRAAQSPVEVRHARVRNRQACSRARRSRPPCPAAPGRRPGRRGATEGLDAMNAAGARRTRAPRRDEALVMRR